MSAFLLFSLVGCAAENVPEADSKYDAVIETIYEKLAQYNAAASPYETENLLSDIETLTTCSFVADEGFGRYILNFSYDESLSFLLFDFPFTSCTFYLDGAEYKTLEF